MIDQNKDVFDKFFKIHDLYVLDPKANQTEFNAVGRQVQDIIRDYERKLCKTTESCQYSKFSTNLSEKFWGEVRAKYPKIDFVGVQ